MDTPPGIPAHVSYPALGPLLTVAACCAAVWVAAYILWPVATLYVVAGILGVLTSIGLHVAIGRRIRARFKRSESDD